VQFAGEGDAVVVTGKKSIPVHVFLPNGTEPTTNECDSTHLQAAQIQQSIFGILAPTATNQSNPSQKQQTRSRVCTYTWDHTRSQVGVMMAMRGSTMCALARRVLMSLRILSPVCGAPGTGMLCLFLRSMGIYGCWIALMGDC
jgi:hypothetical protein